ncbi:hypothetical protein PG991_015236 [Apiospora marii]|uniref:Uncharacterized protein n=1 Tax=Apiospora marii TaxID=335849 RepID=A0ABR1R122_9PEZI
MSRVRESENGSDSELEQPRKRQKTSMDSSIGQPTFDATPILQPRLETHAFHLCCTHWVCNPNEYKFVIPLSDIPGLNRIALGVRDTAIYIKVRIRLFDSDARYCIYFPPGDLEGGVHWHVPYSTACPWDDRAARLSCIPDTNFLAHLMAKALHQQLRSGEQRLRESLRKTRVEEIRSDLIHIAREASNYVTTCCIVCGKPLGFTAARPIACSVQCQDEFQKWPLNVRLSPLLRDPSMIDLLLTCLNAQLKAIMDPDLHPFGDRDPPPLPEFPDPARTCLVLDTFPPMTPGITLKSIIDSGDMGNERCKVLDWLCSRFQGMIVSAPVTDQVTFVIPERAQPPHPKLKPKTYILMNTNAPRHKQFEDQLAKCNQGGIGSAAFHGSPAQNVLNILCGGLRENPSERRLVWYSGDPFISTYYMSRGVRRDRGPQLYRSWGNSMFMNQQILFGVEIAGPVDLESEGGEECRQERIMVRHLFVIPTSTLEPVRKAELDREDGKKDGKLQGGDKAWARRNIRPQMEATFAHIHNGSLIKEASTL